MRVEIGETYGGRTVLARAGSDGHRNAAWLCRCRCGHESIVIRPEQARSCRSCGNRGNTARRRHNESGNRHRAGSAEYISWQLMQDRCRNPRNKRWDRYGGRGIAVAAEWTGPDGFARFLAHVGRRPSPRHSLDRINCDGNYEPGNVRWSTPQEQQRNRSDNHQLTLDGSTATLAEWSERTGIARQTLTSRLRRGWSDRRALTESVHWQGQALHCDAVAKVLPKGRGR